MSACLLSYWYSNSNTHLRYITLRGAWIASVPYAVYHALAFPCFVVRRCEEVVPMVETKFNISKQ